MDRDEFTRSKTTTFLTGLDASATGTLQNPRTFFLSHAFASRPGMYPAFVNPENKIASSKQICGSPAPGVLRNLTVKLSRKTFNKPNDQRETVLGSWDVNQCNVAFWRPYKWDSRIAGTSFSASWWGFGPTFGPSGISFTSATICNPLIHSPCNLLPSTATGLCNAESQPGQIPLFTGTCALGNKLVMRRKTSGRPPPASTTSFWRYGWSSQTVTSVWEMHIPCTRGKHIFPHESVHT